MTLVRPRTALVLALLPLALAAGCTKAKAPHTNADTVTAPAASGSSSDSTGDSSSAAAGTPTSTAAEPSTPATSPSTGPAPTVSAGSSAPTYQGPPGCATSALRIVVLRGSGIAGHQFASISFTNTSATQCSLVGYPGAVLLKAGSYLGSPAARSGQPVTPVVLKPGATGSAKLENDSTCNAEVSDSVQIIVPNRTEKTVRPLQMRGCPLTIYPVTLG